MRRQDPLERVVPIAALVGVLSVGGLFLARSWQPGAAPDELVEDPRALRRAFAGLEAVGLALERSRAERGRFPDRLEELVPAHLAEVPRDPFRRDGGPLSYGAPPGNPSGRILYSYGPDGVDQGGLPLDPITGRGDLPYPVR